MCRLSIPCASYSSDTKNINSSNIDHVAETDEYDKKRTHFGFQTVLEDEKVDKVYEVFKNVADKYDLMNDVMSAGIHRLWKDELIRHLAPHGGMKLLDMAGGTGDIAFRYLNYSNSTQSAGADYREVTVCDINEHMLKVGEQRAAQQGISRGINWLHANAECLPIEDNSYDAYTIAFGIRNCTHIEKVLSEAYRVLKPGGRFLCLEFSQVRNSLLRELYDQYSFQVIPVMGHVIAQDWHSYQYLVESIRKFPNQETFAQWILKAGFSEVTVTDMTLGAVALHSGFKLL
ncbi:coq5 [Bugula neritina]|uniref:2-methoxy-6-polyprenyl-1,4-benzoquinol methylase, mitochondrial n=1 Tax=Bugula neritina TaxID=10212 RepID=A0A7J7K1Y1_BUGNE|nr:coq5 [Bugula neritina]